MPRPRREDVNEETRQQIKVVARQLMGENGTAGLSLRAIARQMDMSAPALYHYYDSLDALITALIVDAFNAFADAQETARDEAAGRGASLAEQVFAATLMYRQWALDHPVDFQLIYGSPIPGYEAPAEITVPASRRTGTIYVELIYTMLRHNEMDLPDVYREIPPTVKTHLTHLVGPEADEEMVLALYLTYRTWPILHGNVMLELFGHLGPALGDTDAAYHTQVIQHLREIGVHI